MYLVWDQGVPGSNPGAPTSLAIAPPRSDGELRIDDSPADLISAGELRRARPDFRPHIAGAAEKFILLFIAPSLDVICLYTAVRMEIYIGAGQQIGCPQRYYFNNPVINSISAPLLTK